MTSTKASLYRDPRFYVLPIVLLAILILIGWIGLTVVPRRGLTRSTAWMLILALMAAFAVVTGRSITGYWRGILIDNRFKMSLSRLQVLVWLCIVLSALLTASLTNLAFGAQSALAIQVPQELWILLGISAVSGVASPVLMAPKKDKPADPIELDKTVSELQKDDHIDVDKTHASIIVENKSPKDARWSDLLRGDESGNAATVDLGKLQMFFITFVVGLGFCVAVQRLFDGAGPVTALPAVDSTVNTLLGISHTGYLANKVVPHSRESTAPSAGSPEREPTR